MSAEKYSKSCVICKVCLCEMLRMLWNDECKAVQLVLNSDSSCYIASIKSQLGLDQRKCPSCNKLLNSTYAGSKTRKFVTAPNGGADSLKRKRPEGFIQLGDKDWLAQNMAHTVLDESYVEGHAVPTMPTRGSGQDRDPSGLTIRNRSGGHDRDSSGCWPFPGLGGSGPCTLYEQGAMHNRLSEREGMR